MASVAFMPVTGMASVAFMPVTSRGSLSSNIPLRMCVLTVRRDWPSLVAISPWLGPR
jgi:hypothetical protein